MKDKRDECGCHRECSPQWHPCEKPCIWPTCLTPQEERELLTTLEMNEE